MEDFKEKIKPFFWSDPHDDEEPDADNVNVSLLLYADQYYKVDVFTLRSEEGFEGSGYDWASIAEVFINEKMPELKSFIKFDPESGMFCVYSNDRDAMMKFALGFKNACEDDALIRDLFSRAELD